MQPVPRILLVVVLLAAACGRGKQPGGSAAQPKHAGCLATCDLKTDDGVSAALAALTGKGLPSKEDRCVDRRESFPRVVKVGSFASDLGCEWDRAFVDCCLHELRGEGRHQAILADLGWAQAGDAARVALARDYVVEVLWEGDVLTAATADFGANGNPPFTPPEAIAPSAGTARVTIWAQQRDGGMVRTPGPTYVKLAYDFAADGTMTAASLATLQGRWPGEAGREAPATPPPAAPAPGKRPGCLATCAVSTDDHLSAALKALRGEGLPERQQCVKRLAALPRVVVVGSFASDLGCEWTDAFVDCCLSSLQSGLPDVLGDLGWKAATPEARAQLALIWVSSVVNEPGQVVDRAAKGFGRDGNPVYAAPSSSPQADGGVRVILWVQARAGMVKQNGPVYRQLRYDFSSDGAMAATELRRFTGAF